MNTIAVPDCIYQAHANVCANRRDEVRNTGLPFSREAARHYEHARDLWQGMADEHFYTLGAFGFNPADCQGELP